MCRVNHCAYQVIIICLRYEKKKDKILMENLNDRSKDLLLSLNALNRLCVYTEIVSRHFLHTLSPIAK